jgi:hypothetical protein
MCAMALDFMGTPLAPEGECSMSKFQSFAFVASVVGAALITGAASAQTAAPVPAPAANAPAATLANAPLAAAPVAKPQRKSQKKPQESDAIARCRGHQFTLRCAQ